MNTLLALARCLLALVFLVALMAPAQAQELAFTFVEKLVIGDDEEASAEYMFSYPDQVRTDSKGNIYVLDEKRADVRVFSANGEYITTIGKRGEGPGEMQEILGMHVNTQDRLIVVDRPSHRFTIFTDLGKRFDTKRFAESTTISPNVILSFGDSIVMRYVKPIDGPDGGFGIWDDKVLHLHDNQLNWLEKFAPLGDIFDLSQPFLKAISDSGLALSVATNGTDTIVLAPKVYSGIVYRYKRSQNTWVMDKLIGSPAPDKTYVPVTWNEYETNQDVRRAAFGSSGPDGKYIVRVFHWSRAVVILSTGEIINFVTHTPLREPPVKTAELFDQDGNLVGYGPLRLDDPELNSNEDILQSVGILWSDSADRLYITRRNENGFIVLSVAELVISPI